MLQHEHDLIVLRRRLRALADELNFEPRDIGRLSTAAYEAARQLYGAPSPATAELRLVRDPARPSVRVVIRATVADAGACGDLRAGFRHFVPKPVEIDELAAVVRTVAEQH